MKFDDIVKIVRDIPLMQPSEGKILYDFILATKSSKILELGFAHGTSTCYMAAALDELGAGTIITIDNESARQRDPNIDSLLERTGLAKYVTPLYSGTSYTWDLKNILEQQTKNNVAAPIFDFCFIDGAHSWETDGLSFFLIEKLLVPGGWILFDDLDWTYENSAALKATEWVRSMPIDYRTTPQIDRVFSLLVMQHPFFENFRKDKNWGWAQKKGSAKINESPAVIEKLYLDQSIFGDTKRLFKKIAKRILR